MTGGIDLFSLAGRRALITGAAQGIGLAIARLFAEAGASVVIADIDGERAAAAAAELSADGFPAEAMRCDNGVETEVRALARAAGQVDTLVCNAGIEGPVGPIGDASREAFNRVLNVNLMGALWLSGHIIPDMARRGGGSVTLISSIAGLRGVRSIGPYAVSKAALAQLARNLAIEWGPYNVRINTLSPGLIRTPMSAALLGNDAFRERRLGLTPLRRAGEPTEVAGAALFLASAAGGFTTGHNLVIDGGTVIGDGN